MAPLLFPIRENTYNNAFIYAAVVVGLTTGLTLEYRLKDPFKWYDAVARAEVDKDVTTWNVLQTAIAACLLTYFILWSLRMLFGLGETWITS